MSVKTNVYFYYGVRIPYNDDLSEFYSEENDCGEETAEMLFDGMGGKYMILGPMIGHIIDNYNDDIDTISLTPDELLEKCLSLKKVWLEKFESQFPDFMYLIENKEWKYHILTHYS